MNNVSSLGEKIRKIREAEGINRKQLSEMLDIPYSSLNNYEAGRIQVTENIMVKITNHSIFKKYTLWLMNGETAPEAGQIAPAAAHEEQGLEINEKIRAIRVAEGLGLSELSKLLDLSEKMIHEYESGALELDGTTMLKYTNHPRFEKYTLWLMSDQTFPASGQVAPVVLQKKKHYIPVNN